MQTAVLVGMLAGAGLAAVLVSLVPAQPDLRGALSRLNPDRAALARDRELAEVTSSWSLVDWLGRFVDRRLSRWLPLRVPAAELRMLGLTRQRFVGEKVVGAVVGGLFPYAATIVFGLVGVQIAGSVPVVASVGLAALFFFIPDYDVRRRSAQAREEFGLALTAYVDLVALERASGAGSSSALESAARVGSSWVFRRLREELARARFSGNTPWDALERLSAELRLPELADVSDIMRLSGESGVAVYEQLRARARGLRHAQLSSAQARGKASSERITMPQASTAVIFLALLATPAMLKILG